MANSKNPVGILGAGTMGAGIAQVAAVHGWTVKLTDVDKAASEKAIQNIERRLNRQVEKNIITADQREQALSRLKIVGSVNELNDCDLVIEAVVEDFDIKSNLLREVNEVISSDAVIATNTSSLSITKLGEAIGRPLRTVGMHFFNPAPLMPLVEIIRGAKTDPAVVQRVTLIAEAWGKTVARCNDTPGFVVNRVARPFYLESFRVLEEGFAGVGEIDNAIRELGDFRMGPFELTDLIGQDVNAATTRSVWEQLGKSARLRPSDLQEQLVRDGNLGRKTGCGTYDHSTDPPTPDVEISEQTEQVSDRVREAVERFVERATERGGPFPEQYIFARVLVAIINEAAWALSDNVADASDINTAMKLGTNYPKGPLEWAEEIGYATCGELLEALNATVEDRRFEAPDLLKSHV